MGNVLCEHCTGECCNYIALPIDEPDTKRDFDDMRWYLMHGGITVFVEDGDWYIQFRSVCRHLQEDYRCGIYETRPQICREYKARDCDYAGGDYQYEHLFTEPEQIEAFAKKRLAEDRATKPNKRKKKRKAGQKRSGLQQKLTQLNVR